jgi:calcium-dependent protein kinase
LKLENFLYESADSEDLKLIDFGLAKFRTDQSKMSQACGSVTYVAPEVLSKSYTEQADLWSLGIISHMLLTGESVFIGTQISILKDIRKGNIPYGQRFGCLSPVAQDFVKSLLTVDPERRLTAQQALAHPFIDGSRHSETTLDSGILCSLRSYANSSHFRRACLSMMAWSLSREDRQELRVKFLELDSDKKGAISLSRFKMALKDKYHVCDAEAEKLFAMIDIDNDHEICYSEFLAAVLQDRVRTHEDVLRKTFGRFDRGRTGMITVEDLRAVLGDTFEHVEVEDLLREADTDRSGSICYEEFFEYLQHPELDTPLDSDADAEEIANAGTPAQKRKNNFDLADAIIDKIVPEKNDQLEMSKVSKASTRPVGAGVMRAALEAANANRTKNSMDRQAVDGSRD